MRRWFRSVPALRADNLQASLVQASWSPALKLSVWFALESTQVPDVGCCAEAPWSSPYVDLDLLVCFELGLLGLLLSEVSFSSPWKDTFVSGAWMKFKPAFWRFWRAITASRDDMAASLTNCRFNFSFPDFWMGVTLVICPGNSSGWGSRREGFTSLGRRRVNFYFQEHWLHGFLDEAIPRRVGCAEPWLAPSSTQAGVAVPAGWCLQQLPGPLTPGWVNQRLVWSPWLNVLYTEYW